ncbi:MAG: sodium-dependent transporter [Chlamydiia bacterium]|nr:sodium-dependent transporter [Chlamydiia bacterium]
MNTRSSWGSQLGFILSAAGSAIGLANIWRFPYIVGENGGAAFVCLYLICLALIGFPVLIAEVVLGREAKSSPVGAFRQLGGSPKWSGAGRLAVLTALIVSAFYSAIAGWLVGYLFEAIGGVLSHFTSPELAEEHFVQHIGNPWWCLGGHVIFIGMCTAILYFGVRGGIERASLFLMPLLVFLLVLVAVKGLMMEGAEKGIDFLFTPNWSTLTPTAVLLALGQSFFTLSLGQGTMITYGSYLSRQDNIVKSCFPVALMDTFISLIASIAVFTIVFSVGMQPNSGPGLLFETLPVVFSFIPAGYLLSVMFFLIVLIAAVTSEISALEPIICYLIDEKLWHRKTAVSVTCLTAFVLGIPCALSHNLLQHITFGSMSILDFVSHLASSLLIPIGGFLSVIAIGWRFGLQRTFTHLAMGATQLGPLSRFYFRLTIKYTAPLLILIVFLHTIGML